MSEPDSNDETERAQQSRKMEAVGTLTSGVAHDFNNLLMGIDGCAEIALQDLEPDHPARRYIAQIKDAVTRGTALTRQLLTFSRAETAKTAVVTVDEEVGSVERLLRPLLGTGVNLEVELGAAGSRIECREGGLDQIVLNLVVNARDAIDGQGRIAVRTERVEVAEPSSLRVGDLQPGRWVRLEVRDDGSGMDGETVDQIFDPFFTTKPVGEGTGMGLSSVYGIVAGAGGAIDVESEPGRGTVFRVFLPVTEAVGGDGTPERVEDAADAASSPSRPGVLLVEDNDLAREATCELLESQGFSAFDAGTGRRARHLLEEHADAIDLAVIDLTLPDIAGADLADDLRAGRDRLPVVFVSGAAPESPSLEGEDTRFLQKPIGLQTLLDAIRDVLGA